MTHANRRGRAHPANRPGKDDIQIGASPSAPVAQVTPARNASMTRRLARALCQAPVPRLTRKDLAARWSVSAATVRRVLRANGISIEDHKGALLDLTDVLAIEGVKDPVAAWALGTSTDCARLRARLLTIEDFARQDDRLTPLHLDVYRRHARAGLIPALRIGNQYRFRPRHVLVPDDAGNEA